MSVLISIFGRTKWSLSSWLFGTSVSVCLYTMITPEPLVAPIFHYETFLIDQAHQQRNLFLLIIFWIHLDLFSRFLEKHFYLFQYFFESILKFRIYMYGTVCESIIYSTRTLIAVSQTFYRVRSSVHTGLLTSVILFI